MVNHNQYNSTVIMKNLELIEKFSVILGTFAVIGALIIAKSEFDLSKKTELKSTAIEALKEVRNIDFINSSIRLKKFIIEKKIIDSNSIDIFNNDLNRVLNVYDNIAILYNNNLADKCIIKSNIYDAVSEILNLIDSIGSEKINKKMINIKILVSNLQNQQCNE
jgi:hypothetical protein